MKKNRLIIVLLILYLVGIVLLFIKYSGLSRPVIEELHTENIPLIVFFIIGIGIASVLFKTVKAIEDTSNVISEENEITGEMTKIISEDNVLEKNLEFQVESLKAQMSSLYKTEDSAVLVEKMLWKLCNSFEVSQAILYLKEKGSDLLKISATYSFAYNENEQMYVIAGEGLNGQVAKEKKWLYIKDVPEGYMKVVSGLGESLPTCLLIIPVVNEEDKLEAIFELSSLRHYDQNEINGIIEASKYFISLIK